MLSLCTYVYGFISGFSFIITGNTLNFYLSESLENMTCIGLFGLVTLPYSVSFLVSPLFDLKQIKFCRINSRILWVCILQMLASVLVYILSIFSTEQNLLLIALSAFAVSTLTASQNVVLGVVRSEIIDATHQGKFSGLYIFGYRMGMLTSGPGAIYLSTYIGWGAVYKVFAFILMTFPMLTLAVTPSSYKNQTQKIEVQHHKISFKIFEHPIHFLFLVLVFLVFYRFPDDVTNLMLNPFFLDVGFNTREIALAGKLLGTFSAIIGGFAASILSRYLNITKSLLYFGSLHVCCHLLMISHCIYGKSMYILYSTVFVSGFTAGMSMSAYITFMLVICRGHYKVTQYAILTSMMGVSHVLSSISGVIADQYGWINLFIFTFLSGIPSLILLKYMSPGLDKYMQC